MDKLTIPQEDEKLKEQCILGLAGFLQRSETLVILWSESYIGRVWCVYEFAAFTRMHSGKGDVQAVPFASFAACRMVVGSQLGDLCGLELLRFGAAHFNPAVLV